MLIDTSDLDIRACLHGLEASVPATREQQVNALLLTLRYCDLNAAPVPTKRRGGDRLETIGAIGTPQVRQLAIAEHAIALGIHYNSARSRIADALDLAHRLPQIYDLVLALKAEPYVACQVASMTRHLTAEQAARVDARIARSIATQSPGRVFADTRAAIDRVDPVGKAAREAELALKKFVALGRTTEEGLRTIVARTTAGDIAYIEATIVRAADILATQPEHHGRNRDELRALAFGYLGRPAELLVLLLEHTDLDTDDDADDDADEAHNPIHRDPETDPDQHAYTDLDAGRPGFDREDAGNPDASEPPARPTPSEDVEPDDEPEPSEPETVPVQPVADQPPTVEPSDDDEPDPTPAPAPTGLARPLAFPADLLAALRAIGLEKLRATAIIYAHLHQDVLAGLTGDPGNGIARIEGIEGLSHLLYHQLAELLGTRTITLKGVIDLDDQVSTNAYEHPDTLRERVHLLRPGDQFPHGTNLSRRLDLDHPVPYDPNGPPGQTSSETANPLTRTGHRAKTHLGYTVTPLPDGAFLWTTPHGLQRVVDHQGTHHVTDTEPPAIGIAYYHPAFDLEYDVA